MELQLLTTYFFMFEEMKPPESDTTLVMVLRLSQNKIFTQV